MNLPNQLSKILRKHFGDKIYSQQITNIIGYGSGVFKQLDYKPSSNKYQTDLIIMVKNCKSFHKMNFQQNLNDYSGFSYLLGAQYLLSLYKMIFPWHSNHINKQGVDIKYSIVQEDVVIKDIKQWEYFSFAGRLQKPIQLIQSYTSVLSSLINQNYQTALHIALLLMLLKKTQKITIGDGIPASKIPLDKLFITITQMSYIGDLRNTLGIQNPQKCVNIVLGNLIMFKSVYMPFLQNLKKTAPNHLIQLNNDYVLIKYDVQLILTLIRCLPLKLYRKLHQMTQRRYGKQKPIHERVLLMGVRQTVQIIQEQIKKINRKSSFLMGLQNFLGSSPFKNLSYVITKINKKSDKDKNK